MRAILLAAGFGTRLKPLTDSIPKCLVPIDRRPLLDIWLDRLTAAGVGPFLINTHYLSNLVEAYVADSPYVNMVSLVHEPVLRGTAGTLAENADFFAGAEGMLIHADNYCMADMRAFVLAHAGRPAECLMTMLTFRTDTPSTCGIVELDGRGVVTGFHEKVSSPPGNLANGAVYLLSAEAIRRVVVDFPGAVEFSTEILPSFVGRIYSHETSADFLDIGTPESYAQANARARSRGIDRQSTISRKSDAIQDSKA